MIRWTPEWPEQMPSTPESREAFADRISDGALSALPIDASPYESDDALILPPTTYRSAFRIRRGNRVWIVAAMGDSGSAVVEDWAFEDAGSVVIVVVSDLTGQRVLVGPYNVFQQPESEKGDANERQADQ